MEALPHMSGFDVQLLGYCDKVVLELCKLLGWDLNESQKVGEENIPPYRQGSLPHRYIFEGGTEIPFASSSDDESDSQVESDSETGSDITRDEDIENSTSAGGNVQILIDVNNQEGDASKSENEINSNSQNEENVAS